MQFFSPTVTFFYYGTEESVESSGLEHRTDHGAGGLAEELPGQGHLDRAWQHGFSGKIFLRMFHEKKAALCFDADPDPDPTVHFDADADPGSGSYPKFTHFGK